MQEESEALRAEKDEALKLNRDLEAKLDEALKSESETKAALEKAAADLEELQELQELQTVLKEEKEFEIRTVREEVRSTERRKHV